MPRNRRQPPPPEPVSVEYKGKAYSGTYTVEGGLVYVSSAHGSKATQQGNSPAEWIARRLLLELVADYR